MSVRVTETGLTKLPGIFISRLVPGGLAESTGLLSVNDEVLEVNGIEVAGKTLDQVTDMMIANSSNLIITVRWETTTDRTLIRGEEGPKCLAASPTAYMAQAIFSLPVAFDTLGGYNWRHRGVF